jgi:2'-5' RNA ligase
MVWFTAFFPPADVIDQLVAVQDRLRAHLDERLTWVKPEHLHVTVWFLGREVEPERLEAALAWGTRDLPHRFEIELQGLGQRRVRRGDGHRSIFFNGGECEPLARFARLVNSDANRPPHLTLARGRRALTLPDVDSGRVVFSAERLALVSSKRDGRDTHYTVVREWGLPSS